MPSLVIALPDRGSGPRKTNGLLPVAPRYRRRSGEGATFPRWGLGFRQCSIRPIRRASRGGALGAFSQPPLFRHALFPSGFRLQVNPMAQEHSSKFLLAVPGIQHRVTRRTLSTHPALQYDLAQTWPVVSAGMNRVMAIRAPLAVDVQVDVGFPHLTFSQLLSRHPILPVSLRPAVLAVAVAGFPGR